MIDFDQLAASLVSDLLEQQSDASYTHVQMVSYLRDRLTAACGVEVCVFASVDGVATCGLHKQALYRDFKREVWRCPSSDALFAFGAEFGLRSTGRSSLLPPSAATPTQKDYGPDHSCRDCHGTGECSNAQFRCPCRWRPRPVRCPLGHRISEGQACVDCAGLWQQHVKNAKPYEGAVVSQPAALPASDMTQDELRELALPTVRAFTTLMQMDGLAFCAEWQHELEQAIGSYGEMLLKRYPPSSLLPPSAATTQSVEYAALDPGIRDTVRRLNAAGFETSDSGDGQSKPQDWYDSGEAIPFPHVVAATTPATMIADAERMAGVLGPEWNVEAEYQTLTKRAHLFARTLDARERPVGPIPECPAINCRGCGGYTTGECVHPSFTAPSAATPTQKYCTCSMCSRMPTCLKRQPAALPASEGRLEALIAACRYWEAKKYALDAVRPNFTADQLRELEAAEGRLLSHIAALSASEAPRQDNQA